MADEKLDLLYKAIARNAGAVVSLPSAGLLRHCKTRFLADAPGGFWIESDRTHPGLLDELIARKARVGVAFKAGKDRVIFASSILLREPSYVVNRQVMVEALLLELPQEMKIVQRRANYRVVVPSTSDMAVRVWKVPEYWIMRDRPPASMQISARVRDLSSGGIGLLCVARSGEAITMPPDARLRILIKYGEHEALLEGRSKHAQMTPDHSLRVGVQFRKLENTLQGRQTLSKLNSIVAQLQREEVRRLHLGLTA